MVVGAAGDELRHLILARDPAKKRPKPLLERWGNDFSPFFSAEGAMKIGADAGHAGYSTVPSGLRQIPNAVPALKRRAIAGCP